MARDKLVRGQKGWIRHRAKRRKLEYDIIVDQVKRRKEEFIARLISHVKAEGQCIIWTGTRQKDGYGRLSFRWRPKYEYMVGISAHRLFLILKLGRPIRTGYDAGHEPGCPNKHCVRHVFEQPSRQNGQWAAAKQNGEESTPF